MISDLIRIKLKAMSTIVVSVRTRYDVTGRQAPGSASLPSQVPTRA
jgi:hypothetical protein